MTDLVADPVEPVAPVTPPQQPQTTPAPLTPPAGYVEQARFTGAIQKIETLTVEQRALNDQLVQKASEVERLTAQLAERDVEKTVAVSERDKLIEARVTENMTLSKELETLRADQLKLDVIKELGHPELIQIMHTIPAMLDRDVLKTVMTDMLGFTQSQVKARETQILSGVTPPISPVAPPVDTPASDDGWQKLIETLPLNSPERAQAFDGWWKWQQAQTK